MRAQSGSLAKERVAKGSKNIKGQGTGKELLEKPGTEPNSHLRSEQMAMRGYDWSIDLPSPNPTLNFFAPLGSSFRNIILPQRGAFS